MKQSGSGGCGREQAGAQAGRENAAEAAFCGFSRDLAVGVSAFLLIADNQNTGTHADLSQAFICGLIPNNQR